MLSGRLPAEEAVERDDDGGGDREGGEDDPDGDPEGAVEGGFAFGALAREVGNRHQELCDGQLEGVRGREAAARLFDLLVDRLFELIGQSLCLRRRQDRSA